MRKRERDDVYSVEKGVVLYSWKTPSSYGWRVYIRHEDDSTAMYAHLSAIYVEEGQQVKGSERIGSIGDTGNCPSGKHLHLSYFGKYAKELRGEYANDPTFWIQLSGNWPTNTKVSGGFHALYRDATGNEYEHEGIDLYYSKLIDGWEEGNIDPMIQDMRIV